MTPSAVASAGAFASAHIAFTAGLSGALALVAALALLRGQQAAFVDSVLIGAITACVVFLWRRSANMPQLNNDGLPGFSANDWLAPVIVFMVLSLFATVRRSGEDRRYSQARALAVLAAFVVNVVTI